MLANTLVTQDGNLAAFCKIDQIAADRSNKFNGVAAETTRPNIAANMP